jgi:uncharacterized protein YndB with AHSA1/START domain
VLSGLKTLLETGRPLRLREESVGGETFDLQAQVVIEAPRERVFDAWTQPEQLVRWYALNDEWQTASAEVDLQVGGRFRIGLRPPGGSVFYEEGSFLRIAPPDQLVYTCVSGGVAGATEEVTTVTVTFVELAPGRTEVRVEQTGFGLAAARDLHQSGWPHFLERLRGLAESAAKR